MSHRPLAASTPNRVPKPVTWETNRPQARNPPALIAPPEKASMDQWKRTIQVMSLFISCLNIGPRGLSPIIRSRFWKVNADTFDAMCIKRLKSGIYDPDRFQHAP